MDINRNRFVAAAVIYVMKQNILLNGEDFILDIYLMLEF